MTTGCNNSKEQYDSERDAFDATLIPLIDKSINDNKNDIIILTGDFNNAQCHGDLNSKFNEGDYEECKQINYNLNLIKDWLEPYVEMVDKIKVDKADGSGDAHEKKGEAKGIGTFHYKPENYDVLIPNDHIFVRGLNKIVECKSIDTKPWSDHDAIYAELSNEP